MTVDPSTIRGPHNTPCQHCGLIHGKLCPSVKAYEYHPDGSLKRIEFWGAADAVRLVSETVTQEQIDRTRRSTDWREGHVSYRWNPDKHDYEWSGVLAPGAMTWADSAGDD